MRSPAIGLVGCGRLAQLGYLPALAATPSLRLVALADRDTDRAHQAAAAVAVTGRDLPTVHASTAQMLAAHSLDGVVVATPVSSHLEDAREAAAAGVRSLVEKPPALDAAGAAELATLDPAPTLGFNRRFGPGLWELRAATRAAPGPVEVELVLHYRRESWRAHTVRDDALLDLGPHLVDLAHWITGQDVVSVRTAVLAEDQVTAELDLADGRARLSCATSRPHRELVRVRTRGRPLGAVRDGGLVRAVLGRLLPRRPHPLVASLTAQLHEWADALAGLSAPTLGTADDGLTVMTVIDAIRTSATRGGAPVEVVPSLPRHTE